MLSTMLCCASAGSLSNPGVTCSAMILETLAEKDITTESIQEKINDINDIDQLKSLTIAAISARNAEDFKISLEAIQE